MRLFPPRLALAMGLAVLAACGSGGDDVTMSQWAAQADAVCRDANIEVDALGTATDAPAIRDLIRQRAAVRQRELDRLRALPTPPDRDEEIAMLLAGFQTSLDRLREAASAPTLESTVRAIREAQAVVIETRADAADAGLLDCGLDPGELEATEVLIDEERVRRLLESSVNADGRLVPEEVTCIVDTILAAIPVDQIAQIAQSGGDLPPEVVGAVRTATEDCLSPDRLAELAT